MHLHRDLSARYLAENSANSAASQIRLYAVGAIAGLNASVGVVQAVGADRRVLVIFMGISLVTVPEAARILRKSPHRFLPYCVIVGVGLAVCGLIWGVTLYIALPYGLGPVAARGLSLAAGQRARPGLYRLGHGWLPHRRRHGGPARAGGGPAKPAGDADRLGPFRGRAAWPALTLDGAAGTVDGAAASTVVGALVWWWQLRLAIRESPILSGRATATGSLPLAATVAATPSRPAAAGTQAPAAAGTPAPDATGQPLPTGRHRRPASAHHQA